MNQSERYSRQRNLNGFGAVAQDKLENARVLVVGAGGLGVPALQYLAGMGVGNLGIADGDIINLSNLHRQVLYSENEVGKSKAKVAAEKLHLLNSSINIQGFENFITPENALEIIKNYDLVLDATDNFEARYLINDACILLNKPFIYGALFRFEGQISVFNFENGPSYRCLYPTPPATRELEDCNAAGVLGVVPGLIGMYQALEAVKIITGIGKNLSGSLMLCDFLNNEQRIIKLIQNPKNKGIASLQKSYAAAICNTYINLNAPELLNWYESGKDFFVIDVRQPEAFKEYHLEDAQLFPLTELPNQIKNIPENLPIVIVCQTGKRSLKAAAIISKSTKNPQVFNLAGGLQEWQKVAGLKKIKS